MRDRFGAFKGWRGFFIIGAVIAAAIGLVLLFKWLRKNTFRPSRGERGFTLLETVLAVVIIGLIGTGVVKAIDTNARAGRVLDEKIQATNLVTAYLENMRQLTYDDSANPYPTISSNVTIPLQYSIALNIAYSGDGATWWPTSNSSALKLQRMTISVLRTDGRLVLSACTFRTKR